MLVRVNTPSRRRHVVVPSEATEEQKRYLRAIPQRPMTREEVEKCKCRIGDKRPRELRPVCPLHPHR